MSITNSMKDMLHSTAGAQLEQWMSSSWGELGPDLVCVGGGGVVVGGLWGPQCTASREQTKLGLSWTKKGRNRRSLRKQKGPFLSLDADCGSSSCAQVLLAEQVILLSPHLGQPALLRRIAHLTPAIGTRCLHSLNLRMIAIPWFTVVYWPMKNKTIPPNVTVWTSCIFDFWCSPYLLLGQFRLRSIYHKSDI